MHDQAFNLRALMVETVLTRRDRGQRPSTWWLTAGKGGVGTSTMVVNLAAVLARKGTCVLVAATTEQPQDLELLCGLSDQATTRSAALRQGPAGMLVLSPGTASAGKTRSLRFRQVHEALDNFHGCVDLIMVDAGPRICVAEPFAWGPADMLLYVTTGDEVAVLDTYAAIKQLVTQSRSPLPRIGILVNQTVDPRQGNCVFDRIAETTRRFLGTEVYLVGDVPHERTMTPSRQSMLPIVLQSPTSSTARAIERVAAAVTRQTESH